MSTIKYKSWRGWLDIKRREFLKAAATTIVVAATPIAVTSNAQSKDSRKRKRYAMYIDVSKCYGCMACVVACAGENNVPIGGFRTWVERHVKPDGSVIFVPKQCNHCENAPCVHPCPTGATFRREDGLVLVDHDLCIGCGACVEACPYGARYMNPVTGTVDKCTFCDHRLAKGLLPACVEACPTGARVFGDLEEDGELKELVESQPVEVLKSWTGAEPMIFYKGLPKEANR
ncbi:MAG: 4Fe-4S dicluster domain-containing protein [Aeropyrum sp.]|nr:4Fe-4S dicluster domain-containing protein [Aeropyrum sp.]